MRIKIIRANDRAPKRKLAEAEIWFDKGTLDGLKLRGISIWESTAGKEPFVDFPDRRYEKDGETKKYVYLVPIDSADMNAVKPIREAILEAYYATMQQEVS